MFKPNLELKFLKIEGAGVGKYWILGGTFFLLFVFKELSLFHIVLAELKSLRIVHF